MRYLGENSARIFETRDPNLNFDSSYIINKIVWKTFISIYMSSVIFDGSLWVKIVDNNLNCWIDT